MPFKLHGALYCDHPGCSEFFSGQGVYITIDGRLVSDGREPGGWSVGEDSMTHGRRLYVLCPKHAGSSVIQERVMDAVACVAGKPLSVGTLSLVRDRIYKAVSKLVEEDYLPENVNVDIKIETNGTISVALNDPRGAVRPDSKD